MSVPLMLVWPLMLTLRLSGVLLYTSFGLAPAIVWSFSALTTSCPVYVPFNFPPLLKLAAVAPLPGVIVPLKAVLQPACVTPVFKVALVTIKFERKPESEALFNV